MARSLIPPSGQVQIRDLAERCMRDQGLGMRPIPYFQHGDAFAAREASWQPSLWSLLLGCPEPARQRALHSYAFADELLRDVLRNFCPSLPEKGEQAHRTLWAAAVLLDQILDEDRVPSHELQPLRQWLLAHGSAHSLDRIRPPETESRSILGLVALLQSFLNDCLERAVSSELFAAFHRDLISILDAELQSPALSLRQPPDRGVRRTLYNKSALLCWVGFSSCALSCSFSRDQISTYRKLCLAIGEIFWMMDDLADLEEDLQRGLWNHSLCLLHDRIGVHQFRQALGSWPHLEAVIRSSGLVGVVISAVAQRLQFLETHPSIQDAARLRSSLLYWMTSWLGIYSYSCEKPQFNLRHDAPHHP